MCLDLSIPELAFVDAKMAELAADALGGDPVGLTAGRVALVGLPAGVNPSTALTLISAEGDPTFVVGCRLDRAGVPRLVWAQYRKPVTFELSEFERRALSLSTGVRAPGPRPSRSRSR